MSRANRLLSISAAIALTAGFIASPAWAEGSRTGSFWNARDGFASKTWVDHQVDSKNTVITWSGCALTNGDTPTSVQFGLWHDWGLLPDALVGPYRTLGSCAKSASATWYKKSASYTLPSGTYYWKLGKINNSYRGYLVGSFTATY